MSIIDVEFEVVGSSWKRSKVLKSLESEPLLAFDTETCGVYSKDERKEAKKLLEGSVLSPTLRRQYSLVAGNSGLSFPSLVNTTHFIFGLRNDYSIVFVTPTKSDEMQVWEWVKNYQGHLLVHNALFDLKIMYHRIKSFPANYTDTALLTKCLINNANNFHALVGLKELVAHHYKPAWSVFNKYEPDNLFDPEFLDYAAIDGAALMKLWEELQEHIGER